MFWLCVDNSLFLTDLTPLTFGCLPIANFDLSNSAFSGRLFSKIIGYQHFQLFSVGNNMVK
jgi:hypothetical protein